MKNLADFDFDTRRAIAIASAAAVASSSSEALASSMPVRSMTICWKLSRASSRPLAHLGLVGGVGGVPGRVLQHAAQHHRRGDRAVVAHPDHAGEGAVPIRHRAKRFHRLALGQRRIEGERLVVSDRNGDGAAEKVIEGRDADDFEHCLDVPGGGADVTRCEVIPHLDRVERAGVGHGIPVLIFGVARRKRCASAHRIVVELRASFGHVRISRVQPAPGPARICHRFTAAGADGAGAACRFSRAIRYRTGRPPRPSVRRARTRP